MSDGKAHSKLGASSYHRWKACPGSVKASYGIKSESSIYADEGTKAHDIAANILIGSGPLEPVDDEMAEAINVYLDHIAHLRSLGPSFEAVEQRLNLQKYHPELFGTADYVCYLAKEKTLHVVDYKHGRGIPVEVVGSEQLMYYGLGALHMNEFAVENVVLTIVQPRCYHPDGPVRSWATDSYTMLEFAADLIDDALATEKPDAPLVTGDHCRFCPAQPTCPAMQQQALSVVQGAFADESVANYPPEKMAFALSLIPQIKAWCESVHQHAHQQASLGNIPPGWKLVDKRATRKWAEGVNAFILSQALEKDESKFFEPEPKLLSPAQVEKMLPKDKKALLSEFVVKESSGKTLVPCADDRPPVKGAIESMFTTA